MKERTAGGPVNGQESFARLVEQYQGYLMAVILPVVRDSDQAQDVLQETFCQAYRSLPDFRGGSMKAWLARIAVRKAVDWQRQRARHSREVCAVLPEDYREAIAASAEEQYLEKSDRSRLQRMLQNLPPPYREDLAGHLLEGKSYRQLAEENGVSVKTVESRLYRARQKLREQWKEGL